MTPREVNAALDAIENGDPVAELAVRLVAAGMTEEELYKALGGRTSSPIGCELANKYRDVARGWTMNHYQKRWTKQKQP
jgi:hypothetical protein